MKPYFETKLGKLYCGDALEVLKQLPDESVDVVVTSPPYWSKRDYGEATIKKWSDGWVGQLGLEPTPQMFVEHLVEIFREVKRVLKPTGSLFVNIDDSYLGSHQGYGATKKSETGFQWVGQGYYASSRQKPPTANFTKLRKSMALVPELFAIKMVYEEGWILREKIIWAKKVHFYKDRTTKGNAMPESVKDRFAHTWEYILHFTKRPKYYFNLDAVRVPLKESTIKSQLGKYLRSGKINSKYLIDKAQNTRSPGGRFAKIIAEGKIGQVTIVRKPITNVNAYLKQKLKEKGLSVKKLAEITGIKETQLAHYFRTDLSGAALPSREVWEILKPILDLDDYENHIREEYKSILPTPNPLGANPGDVVQINIKPFKDAHFAVFPPSIPELLIKAGCPPDGVVLDPFAGAGTTLVVAEKLGRKWIGIEINPDYCEMIKRRFEKEVGGLVKATRLDMWLNDDGGEGP
jgi:DNA modification methylase